MKYVKMFNAVSKIDENIIDKANAPADNGGRAKKIIITAVCSACLIALVAVLLPAMLGRPGADVPEDTEQKQHFGTDTVSGDVPDWYLPGELQIVSLSLGTAKPNPAGVVKIQTPSVKNVLTASFSAALGAGIKLVGYGEAVTEQDIPNGPGNRFTLGTGEGEYQINDIGPRYIRVYAKDRSAPHFYCDGQFYDTETGSFICLNHHLAELRGVQLGNRMFMNVRGFFDNRCFVELFYEEESKYDFKCALYDFDTDTLTDLPKVMCYAIICGCYRVFDGGKTVVFPEIAVRSIFNKGMKLAALTDNGYVITDLPCDDGYLALSAGGARITENGRYVLYAAPSDNGEYKHIQIYKTAKFRVVDLQTLEYNDVTGKFITLTEDSKYVIFENKTGIMLYDIEQNKTYGIQSSEVDRSFEKTAARYEISKKNSDRAGMYNVAIRDLVTGNNAEILEYVDSYALLGQYMYYFDSDRMVIVCREAIPGGKSFEITLSEEFASAFRDHGDDSWNYSRLKVSPDGKRLLLCFCTYANDYIIWMPEGATYAPIPDNMQKYPPQFWGYAEEDKAMLEMIIFRDESVEWKAEIVIKGKNTARPIDIIEAALAADMFDSTNGTDVPNSTVDGAEKEFTICYECTFENGEKVVTKASGYIIKGEYYINFNNFRTVKIINQSSGENIFSWLISQYSLNEV